MKLFRIVHQGFVQKHLRAVRKARRAWKLA